MLIFRRVRKILVGLMAARMKPGLHLAISLATTRLAHTNLAIRG